MIKKILEEKKLEIYFQPIVSIRRRVIYAFEALTRCTYEGKNISPDTLFYLARKDGLLQELDTYTRVEAIKKFKAYYEKNNDLILFLNFESRLIDNGVFISKDDFISTIDDLQIPYTNFLIEIKEDEITNTQFLMDFCKKYRTLGFSIALDDFGTGSSTFDRINIIKPDIIKIDKSLFVDIKNNHVNKEIVKAIASMCHNIGTRVLSEGVEDEVAICESMRMGINLYQGYFFSKPSYNYDEIEEKKILEKVLNIGSIFKEHIISTIKQKREMILNYNLLIESMITRMNNISSAQDILKDEFSSNEDIEAIYLIDSKNSKQINDTIISKVINKKFHPTKCGDEHYLKEYYYITKESAHGWFLSEKYISYATGSICKTFSKIFSINDREYIICIDIVIEGK